MHWQHLGKCSYCHLPDGTTLFSENNSNKSWAYREYETTLIFWVKYGVDLISIIEKD